MNTEAKITDDEMRVKIAESCGWKMRDEKDLPDYLNDLNAMHEAEKSLSDDQRDMFFDKLRWNGPPHFTTARQRAEAFLAAISK